MTSIFSAHGLPFVLVIIRANGNSLTLRRVLLDTGSAATIFRTDDLEQLGIAPQPTNVISEMRGVGGGELVIQTQIDSLEIGELTVNSFTTQMGAMNYGIPMDGIVGIDFLQAAGAIINLKTMQVVKG